jgi:hypothetical protein
MPGLLWLYLTALLYYRTSATCVALAEALQTVSHDRLTRLLQANWSGQTLLELAFRTLFVCERGYLIIDDTVMPQPFATTIEGLAWVFSSQERRPVYGLSLVLLVWTDGTLRIPLGLRLWRQAGSSKAVTYPDAAALVAFTTGEHTHATISNHPIPDRAGLDRPARAHPFPHKAPTLDPLITPPREEGYPCESQPKSSHLISREAAWGPTPLAPPEAPENRGGRCDA